MQHKLILDGWGSVAVILLCMMGSGLLAAPATSPSTRPVMAGRDTPAGAMTVFIEAIENRDLATVADCYNLPEAVGCKRAAEQISNSGLYRALVVRFGEVKAAAILADARLEFTSHLQKYSADDWSYPQDQPNVALSKGSGDGSAFAPTMQKGPDGVWRIGLIRPHDPSPPGLVTAMKAKALERSAKYDPIVSAIQAGKYGSPDEVMNALIPPDSPEGQARAIAEQQRKQQEEADQQFLSVQFDPTTLDGAAGLYMQFMMKKDLDGMVKFYYVEKATDDRFARAYAKRILGATALAQALASHVPGNGNDDLVKDFGLMPDLPKEMILNEHGDRGIGTISGPDQRAIWFRKVSGMWKQDITPPTSVTLAEAAQATDEDNAAVDRIAADVVAGKYTSIRQIRDALGEAMLNATPEPTFVQGGMRVSEDPMPAMPQNPTPAGPVSTDRRSPAGAMNVLIGAMKNSDEATVADSLYMPQDKDSSCRAAAAKDLIAGYRFLLAVETRLGGEAAQPISYWCGSVQPWVLDPYYDGDWAIALEYPDLAFLNSLSGSNGNYGFRSGVILHRCSDGRWRVGPRFAKNARQVRTLVGALTAKTVRMEGATTDIKAGKYASAGDVIKALSPNGPDEDATKIW